MPRTTDRTVIRALLAADRPWAAYALGDLKPGLFEHCKWFRATKNAWALALFFGAREVPVLFAIGDVKSVEQALRDVDFPPHMKLSVLPDVMPFIKSHYDVQDEKAMWRMVLRPKRFRPVPAPECRRLSIGDLPALEALYADGRQNRTSPGFFIPSMLEGGVFYGVWQADALIAAAGTHLVNQNEGVAAIGNVYTRSDARGQGLASKTTSAVASDLFANRVDMIVLNVAQANLSAVHVYERLGFEKHCAFYEGLAVKRS